MKKRIFFITLFISLTLLTAADAFAATRFSNGIYTFEKTEDASAVIVACDVSESVIEVPGQVLGYPVTGIGSYAFMDYVSAGEIILPDSVSFVGEYAFAENPDLQYVTILRNCNSISGNAFFNTPNVTICCYYDSPAYLFAKEKGISAELLDNALLGDANGDGTVNISDVTAIQRHIASLKRLSGIYLKTSDVNTDGGITITDATTIQRFLAEYAIEDPVGEVMTQ